jgi:hypothetical protein
MATREELLQAARNADRNMSGNDKPPKQPEGASGLMPFLNKSMAELAGAPVDLISSGLGRLAKATSYYPEASAQPSEKPIGGSKHIREMLAATGAPTPDRQPETAPEYVGQAIGEMASMSIPMLKGAKMLSKGSGIAAKIATPIVEQAIQSPIRTGAIELAGASGAGVGRQFGEEQGYGAGGKLTSEFVGGAVPAVLTSLSPTSLVSRGTKKIGGWAIAPYTEKGATLRASRRMQEIAENPVQAALNIEDLKGSNLSVSAASQDPGLMAIENTVLKDNPALNSKSSRATSDATDELVKSIRKSGSIKDTRNFVKAKLDRLDKSLTLRVEQAADEAAGALSKLDGNEAQASVAVRESLEGALADAKVQENFLWQTIPSDAKASIKPVMDTFNRWQNTLSSAQRADIPPTARRILGEAAERKISRTTIRELDGLYKKLGEEATAARATGSFTQAKIAEDLRDSILKSMDTAEGGPAVKEAVTSARAYSRAMNERFRRGAVGKILGYGREGGPKIAPELALGSTISQSGPKSSVALREISEAAKFGGNSDVTVLEGVQSYLKDRFAQTAVRNGEVQPNLAASFLRNNRDMLEALPHLREQFMAAKDTADAMRRVTKATDGFRRLYQRPDVSVTARLLRSPVDKEITRILSSDNPVDMMARLSRMAAKDKTGKATNGLKAGFSEWLIDQATSGSKIDVSGRNSFYGMKLKSIVDSDHVSGAMSKVYSKDEIKRIKELSDTLGLIHRRGSEKSLSPIIEDAPAWYLSIVGRVLGAKAGAALSGTTGGSIQAASIGSSSVKKFLDRITADKAKQMIIDSFQDADLMSALLNNNVKASAAKQAKSERAIRAWMLGSGSRLLDEELYEAAESERKSDPTGLIRVRNARGK